MKKINIFDKLKNNNEFGSEFWYARELQEALEYAKWDNFRNVIEKAINLCRDNNVKIEDHFTDVGKMINIGKGAEREIEDFIISKYACYLILQKSDQKKKLIQDGLNYFISSKINDLIYTIHPKNILIYESDVSNKIRIEARFEGETVWLNLQQIAQLFQRDKSTISRHIKNIIEEKELQENSVVANNATTGSDGKTYNVSYYNLDLPRNR